MNILKKEGWECPKCGNVYSPVQIKCVYCPAKPTSTTSTTTQINYNPFEEEVNENPNFNPPKLDKKILEPIFQIQNKFKIKFEFGDDFPITLTNDEKENKIINRVMESLYEKLDQKIIEFDFIPIRGMKVYLNEFRIFDFSILEENYLEINSPYTVKDIIIYPDFTSITLVKFLIEDYE